MNSKIAFASDLDRTLIYSYKSFDPIAANLDFIDVDSTSEKKIGYMTKEALRLLNELSQDVLFIPVSARTEEQFNRISWGINHEYAILYSGEKIFEKGFENLEWSDYVSSLYNTSDLRHKEKELLNILKKVEVNRNGYRFCISKKLLSKDDIKHIKDLNCIVEFDHRNLNVSLININKAVALNYLKSNKSIDFIFTSGDSDPDSEMILNFDDFIISKSGYFSRQNPILDIECNKWTTTVGAKSAEEIILTFNKFKEGKEKMYGL